MKLPKPIQHFYPYLLNDPIIQIALEHEYEERAEVFLARMHQFVELQQDLERANEIIHIDVLNNSTTVQTIDMTDEEGYPKEILIRSFNQGVFAVVVPFREAMGFFESESDAVEFAEEHFKKEIETYQSNEQVE